MLKRSLWSHASPEPWYTPKETWKKKVYLRYFSLAAYVGRELLVYLSLYYILQLIYRKGLKDLPEGCNRDAMNISGSTTEKECSGPNKKLFEDVVDHMRENVDNLSKEITFLLGFYVSLVVKRWADQCRNLPWPGELALLSTGLTHYETEEGRILSEEVSRYQMLSYILCMRKISKVIKKKFPSSSELLEYGFITPKELKVLEGMGSLDILWWVPLQWSMHRIKVANKKKILSDQKELLKAVTNFKAKLDAVECSQTVDIPPVYKQVVNLGVHAFLLFSLIGYQAKIEDPADNKYFPFFLVLKFVFFMGWLKVAWALSNPYGDDFDDLDIENLLTRHIWASGLHLEAGFAGPPENDVENDNEDDKNHRSDELQILTVDK